jgi:hypothetical protein
LFLGMFRLLPAKAVGSRAFCKYYRTFLSNVGRISHFSVLGDSPLLLFSPTWLEIKSNVLLPEYDRTLQVACADYI